MKDVQSFACCGAQAARTGLRSRPPLACGVALYALAAASGAWAQQPAPQGGVSDDIIVTAQRRSERLEEVPASVTALSADTLQSAGITSVQDLGRVTPGLQVGMGGVFTAPSIRGITTIANGNNIENNVAVYVDGFYQANALAINGDLPNIASVEVLKGPQGTLYGRNATGGAILINTLDPTSDLVGRAEITYARFDDKRASAFVSGPLTSRIGASLAAYRRRSEGYVKLADPAVIGGKLDKGAAPLSQDVLRAKLKFDVSDAVTATAAYNYAFTHDPRGGLFSVIENVPPSAPLPPARPTDLGVAAYNYETNIPAKSNQGTLKLEIDTGAGTITSYSGYTRTETRTDFDFDGSYIDQVYSRNEYLQDTYQQAVDITLQPVDRLDVIAGGLYYHDTISSFPLGTQGFGPALSLRTQDINKSVTKAWAVYVDGTWDVTDALTVNFGGRYSSETKSVDFTAVNVVGGVPTIVPGFPLERNATSKRFTPRASVRYEIADRTNVYASYSKGFRSAQFALSRPNPAAYSAVLPEDVNAYEVGFKTAGRGIRLNAAAFYYDYKNLQVNVAVRSPACLPEPAPCSTLATLFSNAPKAEVYGLEAEFELDLMENLKVRGGAAYTHARFKDFKNAIGTGVNAAGLNVTQTQDWSNKQLARAPDLTGNIGIDYRIPIGDGGFDVSANASYTSRYVISNPSLFGPLAGNLAGKQRFVTGPYALVNAQVTYTEPSGHAYIGLFGRNLTDKRYRLTYNGTALGTYSALAEPLTYGVRAGFRY